jgi:hypothetical protein
MGSVPTSTKIIHRFLAGTHRNIRKGSKTFPRIGKNWFRPATKKWLSFPFAGSLFVGKL